MKIRLMRLLFTVILLSIIVMSCDTKLSDEQRKAFQEEMENREIKKIMPEDIYRQAQVLGEKYAKAVQSGVSVDSLAQLCQCEISFAAKESELQGKAKEVFQAYGYVQSAEGNVQKDGDEKFLYSQPVFEQDSLVGVWFVYLEKKDVIQSL